MSTYPTPGLYLRALRSSQQPFRGGRLVPFSLLRPLKFREVKELAQIHPASEGGHLHGVQVSLAKGCLSRGPAARLCPTSQLPPSLPLSQFPLLFPALRTPFHPSQRLGEGSAGGRGVCVRGASFLTHGPATPSTTRGHLQGHGSQALLASLLPPYSSST